MTHQSCKIGCVYKTPLFAHLLMGQNIDGCTSLRNLTENIDGQHLRPPVLAILLETIERENSDGLLA